MFYIKILSIFKAKCPNPECTYSLSLVNSDLQKCIEMTVRLQGAGFGCSRYAKLTLLYLVTKCKGLFFCVHL